MLRQKRNTISLIIVTTLCLFLAITVLKPSMAAGFTVSADEESTNFQFPTGSTREAMNAIIAGAPAGSTFTFADPNYPYPGGLVVSQSQLTFILNGAAVSSGSPAFTINGDDISIQGPGTLDGAGSLDAGILVNAGADNFILDRTEIKNWRDGLELSGSVTSFKVVNNWFHENSSAGLLIDSGVVISGVVSIEGNLFKENGGNGIQNNCGTGIDASYNSWGHLNGPASGDGVSADVSFTPWNFLEVYMDVDPDNELFEKEILESDSVTVDVKLDASNIYGLTFSLAYDSSKLDLISTSLNPTWQNNCDTNSSSGEIALTCFLEYPQPEYSADGAALLHLNFTAKSASVLPGDGPWEALFDIAHNEIDTSAGALGGVKVWVNNAGFGAPSLPGRDISTTDDGKLIIIGPPNYSGFVDLEGRTDDSGALVQVFFDADKDTPTELANATSASSGAYITAHLFINAMQLDNTYFLLIDRELYLPTTILGIDDNIIPNPSIPSTWANSALLWKRMYTPLKSVLLLGGDATDDNVIDIRDAGCISGAYGMAPGACGSSGSSDVNGDGVVNLLDLTLMAGNYTRNYSQWNP